MIAQDFAALDALLADDVVYIHSTAVAENKRGYFAGVRDGLYDYGAIESRDVTVRHLRRCRDPDRHGGDVGRGARPAEGADHPAVHAGLEAGTAGWRLWQRQATRRALMPIASSRHIARAPRSLRA